MSSYTFADLVRLMFARIHKTSGVYQPFPDLHETDGFIWIPRTKD